MSDPLIFRSRIACGLSLTLIALTALIASISDSSNVTVDELIALPFFDTHLHSAELKAHGSVGSLAKVSVFGRM